MKRFEQSPFRDCSIIKEEDEVMYDTIKEGQLAPH